MEQLTSQDIRQIQSKGLSQEDIKQQVLNFKQGFPSSPLVKPATIGDGIRQPSQPDMDYYQQRYNQALHHKGVMKFVPASGAATRMFKFLFEYLEDSHANTQEVEQFIHNLRHFAFYEDLETALAEKGQDLNDLVRRKHYHPVIEELIGDEGLAYGQLPKGLIKFHRYSDHTRTPAEEHLVEGAHYSLNRNDRVNLHFTVLPEHQQGFKTHLNAKRKAYEHTFHVYYDLHFSNQQESTDRVAVDMDNALFRNPDGSLLFRPGGHGALLNNLNMLQEDVIFIKNIDNVVPDRLKKTTYDYKKVLAGILVHYQEQIFQYLRALESGDVSQGQLDQMADFVQRELNVLLPREIIGGNSSELAGFLHKKLNRPIRVCGMVKNQGEPGGGPFWVRDADGSVSLQIVEKAQINQDDPGQKEILDASTHFNPVDLVCGIRNYQGEKFDLFDFRDPSAGIISTKSKGGRKLKAQELPGLWNGAMAWWNTIFVEVPLSTFNPVKTINDLLRNEHQ